MTSRNNILHTLYTIAVLLSNSHQIIIIHSITQTFILFVLAVTIIIFIKKQSLFKTKLTHDPSDVNSINLTYEEQN